MRDRFSRAGTWLYEYRSGALFLVFALLGLIFYELEATLVPKYWMASRLDAYIPFLPAFVIPYLAWFFFIGIGLAVLFFRDRETFVPTISLLCAGMAAAIVVFILFPNGQRLRPRNVGEGPFAWLVAHLIYANDTNTNCCPSLHVMNQLAVYSGLCRSRLLESRPGVRRALWVLTVLVCASTVFIKQHSIEDVVVALIIEFFLRPVFFPEPAPSARVRAKRTVTEY